MIDISPQIIFAFSLLCVHVFMHACLHTCICDKKTSMVHYSVSLVIFCQNFIFSFKTPFHLGLLSLTFIN